MSSRCWCNCRGGLMNCIWYVTVDSRRISSLRGSVSRFLRSGLRAVCANTSLWSASRLSGYHMKLDVKEPLRESVLVKRTVVVSGLNPRSGPPRKPFVQMSLSHYSLKPLLELMDLTARIRCKHSILQLSTPSFFAQYPFSLLCNTKTCELRSDKCFCIVTLLCSVHHNSESVCVRSEQGELQLGLNRAVWGWLIGLWGWETPGPGSGVHPRGMWCWLALSCASALEERTLRLSDAVVSESAALHHSGKRQLCCLILHHQGRAARAQIYSQR